MAVIAMPLAYPRINDNEWKIIKGKGGGGYCRPFAVLSIVSEEPSSQLTTIYKMKDPKIREIIKNDEMEEFMTPEKISEIISIFDSKPKKLYMTKIYQIIADEMKKIML